MLLEFSCSNFRSIKDPITLSMIATNDSTYENELIHTDKYRISRIASIYGGNGSGKTSIIQAIEYLKFLVVSSLNYQLGDKIPGNPHKLSLDDPTILKIQFIKNNVRFAYGLSVTRTHVTEEYLYHFPKGRQALIFDRKGDEINIGDIYLKDSETAKNILKPNKLFLSCAANYSSIKEYETAFMFFKEDLVVYSNDHNNWLDYSVESLGKDPAIKRDFIDFMHSIGTGLVDVRTKIEQKRFDANDLPSEMPDLLKDLITSQDANIIDVKLDYNRFTLDLEEESSGIKKLFEILCPLIDIIKNDKILIWDEFETNFHPCIITDLLAYFQQKKTNSQSQLIFTTHDINLLDLKRFRRDQIWFTELTSTDRSTDFYSLAELKNVRKDENIQKGYISGKYGAIPCLSDAFSQLFNER
ncbi:AAA domain, putative AbiEii toxin, Type IV TA system [anaerobic digester metagenome]